ncbi:MAG: hypothetical protein E3K37_12515 [Candidatus Kuenenia sp.]|nr:hypothetical protein [Candidatus Kuenenia hertensis]
MKHFFSHYPIHTSVSEKGHLFLFHTDPLCVILVVFLSAFHPVLLLAIDSDGVIYFGEEKEEISSYF